MLNYGLEIWRKCNNSDELTILSWFDCCIKLLLNHSTKNQSRNYSLSSFLGFCGGWSIFFQLSDDPGTRDPKKVVEKTRITRQSEAFQRIRRISLSHVCGWSAILRKCRRRTRDDGAIALETRGETCLSDTLFWESWGETTGRRERRRNRIIATMSGGLAPKGSR